MLLTTIYVINGIYHLVILVIVLQAIMSWFVASMPDPIFRFYELLCNLTEPVISPFRRITERFIPSMGVDFSPLIAILVIGLVKRILISVLLYLR